MIGAPPSVVGVSQSRPTSPVLAVATAFIGLPGAVGASGVYASEISDGGPVPIALRALIRNLWGTPSVKPVIVR